MLHRGYLLHLRPFRENSAIVNLLVDGAGRVDAIARLGGGKRSSRALLQPFQPLLFTLSGKGELRTLNQPEAYAPAIPLQGDSLYAGMYLNELLMRSLSHSHGGDGLFYTYHQTLMTLAAGFEQRVLRYFELELLKDLGICPPLESDVTGNTIEPDICYLLKAQGGFIPSLAPNATPGRVLLSLANQSLADEDFQSAKKLLRQLLAPVIGDKPLVSRALFAGRSGRDVPAGKGA
ncbi:DNA repair protein RecO [Shewanella sp. JM162201]|uniref:DNA repair protein RecO n=1 Tax=Shewanella jiangmenensis TaxID=2837387 RepID=A0ABS5V218_9GAMM|nr:DNA repair protein RecO [Shewanella jiangmenensis]MBT1444507.1 DNA repair protein RecO [Shewanella jiangmenensis]